jgi:hypothetical protein
MKKWCAMASPHALGDVVNVLALLNTLLFLFVVRGHHQGWFEVLSPAFARDGFCVSNKDASLYVQSHALCLYSDTAFSVLLAALTWLDRSPAASDSVALVSPSILGIFGHGVAHMLVGHKFESATAEWMQLTPFQRNEEPVDAGKYYVFLLLFWFGLIRSFHPGRELLALAFALAYTTPHFLLAPGRLAFTYVNCLLAIHGAINSLAFAPKGRYYNASSVLLALPCAVVAWFEALSCERHLRPIGGHLVYDTVIPLSLLALYFWVRAQPKAADKVD